MCGVLTSKLHATCLVEHVWPFRYSLIPEQRVTCHLREVLEAFGVCLIAARKLPGFARLHTRLVRPRRHLQRLSPNLSCRRAMGPFESYEQACSRFVL